MYQTGSVDTQVAAFNKGKGINYQLRKIASNKTGEETEKNGSEKADTMLCKLPGFGLDVFWCFFRFFFTSALDDMKKRCQRHNY